MRKENIIELGIFTYDNYKKTKVIVTFDIMENIIYLNGYYKKPIKNITLPWTLLVTKKIELNNTNEVEHDFENLVENLFDEINNKKNLIQNLREYFNNIIEIEIKD